MKTDLSPLLNNLHNLIGEHNTKNPVQDFVHDTSQNVPIYLRADVPPVDPIYDLDIKVDGEHTFEPRPTHCGFSHYLHGESYDVLLDPLNINDKVGINPGDNIDQVFMEYFKVRGLEGRVNHEELAKHIRDKISENEDVRKIVNSKEPARKKRPKITSVIPPVPKSTSAKTTTTTTKKTPAATKTTRQEAVKTSSITKVASDPFKTPITKSTETPLTKSASDIPTDPPTVAPVIEQQPKPISSRSAGLNTSNERAMEEYKRRNEENLKRQKEQREREEKEKREREILQMLQTIDNISIQKRLQATNTFTVRVQLYGARSIIAVECRPGDTYAHLRERLVGASEIKDYHLVITTGTTHSFVDDDDLVTPMATIIQIPTNATR